MVSLAKKTDCTTFGIHILNQFEFKLVQSKEIYRENKKWVKDPDPDPEHFFDNDLNDANDYGHAIKSDFYFWFETLRVECLLDILRFTTTMNGKDHNILRDLDEKLYYSRHTIYLFLI